MTSEDEQDNISPIAYPILLNILEAERAAVGLSVADLAQEVARLLDAKLDLVTPYYQFIQGDRLALSWSEAFLIALSLNIGPRDLLLSFPSAFDMGGKPYIIIYHLDPGRSKHEIWQQFLKLWRES